MAVISCPNCKKKISDKAKSCTHCDISMESLDEDKLRSINHQKTIKKSQSIMTQSCIAMLLFCGGFLFLYSSNAQPDSWKYNVSIASTGLGFCLYIVNRIRLVIFKRSQKS